MINNKKAIVCDLDGTLAESKSALSPEMSKVLCEILSKHYLVVVSGGAFPQFQKQFLSNFSCPKELYTHLYLFPTMGSVCFVYDNHINDWKRLYEEELNEDEKQKIKKAINDSIVESGLDLSHPYGDIIEDRSTQITFSGRGQEAPKEVKEVWDPNRTKRVRLVDLISRKLPDFDVRIGGMTSIDITRKGIDKAYAIGKIKEILKIDDEDIIFVGDALWEGGNDAPVKKTNVDYIQEDGPQETIELLRQYL